MNWKFWQKKEEPKPREFVVSGEEAMRLRELMDARRVAGKEGRGEVEAANLWIAAQEIAGTELAGKWRLYFDSPPEVYIQEIL